MANRLIYPRGFEDVDPATTGPGITNGVGDVEVDQLFRKLTEDSSTLSSWEYRVAVMRCAKRLFGVNLATWIGNQSNSEFVTTQAREFIIDTLCFIRTGTRSIHPRNWVDILPVGPLPLTHIPNRPLIPAYAILKNEYSVDFHYIEAWLKQPHGLSDLIYSLYIIFGSSSAERTDGYEDPKSPRNIKFNRLAHVLLKNV